MIEREDLETARAAAERLPRAWTRAGPGAQLRALRMELDVSQKVLAAAAGMDASRVCRLERGDDAPLETWRRLYQALGCEAVLVPLGEDEEARGLLKDMAEQRLAGG